jgi:hypothetical protein
MERHSDKDIKDGMGRNLKKIKEVGNPHARGYILWDEDTEDTFHLLEKKFPDEESDEDRVEIIELRIMSDNPGIAAGVTEGVSRRAAINEVLKQMFEGEEGGSKYHVRPITCYCNLFRVRGDDGEFTDVHVEGWERIDKDYVFSHIL